MKNPKIKLPSKWTPAQIRTNAKGEVQISINPAKLGTGGRVAKGVKSVKLNPSIRKTKKAFKKEKGFPPRRFLRHSREATVHGFTWKKKQRTFKK